MSPPAAIEDESISDTLRLHKRLWPTRDLSALAACHSKCVLEQSRNRRNDYTSPPKLIIDGNSLDISSVVSVARHDVRVHIDPETAKGVEESVEYLRRALEPGHAVYGVTTGFGGSADTRTTAMHALQRGLLQMQHCGILPLNISPSHLPEQPEALIDDNGRLYMPEAWVRAAMLIRCNSLLRGHSAVRMSVIESLATLLRCNFIPLVPLRGSISASGDLSPLSYIAGALEGNPDIRVWVGSDSPRRESSATPSRRLVPANEALALAGLEPIVYGPKEALGMMNGTAFSAGVAALALHETNHLAVLAQVLTAMGVEALLGTAESFDPRIAAVRPHPGQSEVARNILHFLTDSKLAVFTCTTTSGSSSSSSSSSSPSSFQLNDQNITTSAGILRQDRYPLRTSSQWLGPLLEDLLLANQQLTVEVNSTTDNPLIITDSSDNLHSTPANFSRDILHGGNFQATSVTSATEKSRFALHMMGRLLFAQCTELINPLMNRGLPPNLAADEPSLSYTMKGIDINIAAYVSELSFLANPVSNHVQSAEMGNQAVNSLALVSARYTHKAVDIASMISACYLYCVCQALDLRALQARFEARLADVARDITGDVFRDVLEEAVTSRGDNGVLQSDKNGSILENINGNVQLEEQAKGEDQVDELLEMLISRLWNHISLSLGQTTRMDSPERFTHIAHLAQSVLCTFLCETLLTVKSSAAAFTCVHLPDGAAVQFQSNFQSPDNTLSSASSSQVPGIFPASAPAPAAALQPPVAQVPQPATAHLPLSSSHLSSSFFLDAIHQWTRRFSITAHETYISTREEYFAAPDARHLLGRASRKMYEFVRVELRVPFHTGIREHPVCPSPIPKPDGLKGSTVATSTCQDAGKNKPVNIDTDKECTTLDGKNTLYNESPDIPTIASNIGNVPNGINADNDDANNPGRTKPERTPRNIGTDITTIYHSLRNGGAYRFVLDCL